MKYSYSANNTNQEPLKKNRILFNFTLIDFNAIKLLLLSLPFAIRRLPDRKKIEEDIMLNLQKNKTFGIALSLVEGVY